YGLSVLSPTQEMLIAVHWLGNDGQHHSICDMHEVSRMTVCRFVREFVDAVNQINFNEIISWPADILNVEEDSAYPLNEWSIPPAYEDSLNPAQNAFNRALDPEKF
ncbi:hypothetical protein NQ314_012518, partial [Rhamnusium bicolor]